MSFQKDMCKLKKTNKLSLTFKVNTKDIWADNKNSLRSGVYSIPVRGAEACWKEREGLVQLAGCSDKIS